MRVKVLIDSRWAINPPYPGELNLFEGETRDDIPQHLLKRILACDTEYIEVLEEGSIDEDIPDTPHVLDDVSDIRAVLMDIVDNADDKNNAKKKLREWGKESMGFVLDIRRNVDNCVADLISAYEDRNG